jgi:hypothetical protein
MRQRGGVELRLMAANEGLLVDLRTGECFRTNSVGAEVWQLLAEPRTLEELRDTIAARHDRPVNQVAVDLDLMIDQLTRAGLLGDVTDTADFRARYLVRRCPEGGVIVDLQTGNFFRVNESAALICQLLCDSAPPDEALARVALVLRISETAAATAVNEVVNVLEKPSIRGVPQGSARFLDVEEGWELWAGERRLLQIAPDLRVRLPEPETKPDVAVLEVHLRTVAPKLLFGMGVTVVHASACIIGEALVAFAGLSGAGKTTTARAFASSGARLVSEDLVVVSPGLRGHVVLDAEELIREWAVRTARELERDPSMTIDTSALNAVTRRQTMPLTKLLCVDRARRSGLAFSERPLPLLDALCTLMEHNFLGADTRAAVERFLESTLDLVRAVNVSEVSCPDGLEALAAATRSYVVSG